MVPSDLANCGRLNPCRHVLPCRRRKACTMDNASLQVFRSQDDLLTPGQVADLFGVDPKTVTRWATAGKLDALRTLGGHRRYRRSEVEQVLHGRAS